MANFDPKELRRLAEANLWGDFMAYCCNHSNAILSLAERAEKAEKALAKVRFYIEGGDLAFAVVDMDEPNIGLLAYIDRALKGAKP